MHDVCPRCRSSDIEVGLDRRFRCNICGKTGNEWDVLTVFRDGQVLENAMRSMIGELSHSMASALYPVITKFCSTHGIEISTQDMQWLLVESVKQQTRLIFKELIERAPSCVRDRLRENEEELALAIERERAAPSEEKN